MVAAVGSESERWCIVLIVVERDGSLVLVVEPTRAAVPCPQCGELSRQAGAQPAAATWPTLSRTAGDCDMVVSATPSENTVRFYLGRGFQPWRTRRLIRVRAIFGRSAPTRSN